MNRKRLVTSSVFQLRNSDIQINVDRFGQLQITELRFGRDWNDHGHARGNDRDYGHDRDRDGRF